jgi:hypothetical protein
MKIRAAIPTRIKTMVVNISVSYRKWIDKRGVSPNPSAGGLTPPFRVAIA